MSDNEEMFVYNDFWVERSQIEEKEFSIEEIKFLFLKLTSAMVKELIGKNTVNEKLCYAAECGMSWNRERIIDNENLSKDLELFWVRSQLKYPPTPSLKHQAGEYVCGISGLSAHIKETQAVEDEIKKEEDEKQAYEENEALGNVVDIDSVSIDDVMNDAEHALTA